MRMFLKRSACDFFTCSLSNEGRTREPARRGSHIDLIDKRFIQRNIDSYGSPGIGKQWHCKKDRSSFERCLYIFVTQHIVHFAWRRQQTSRAFKGLRVLPQCSCRIRNSFFQRLAGREASLHIRKPNAEGAVSLFFNNSYITHRYFSKTLSRPPAGQFVNAAHQPDRQISPRMCHCNDQVPVRILVRVVITVDPIKHPAIPLQHSNQFSAVSFQALRPKQTSKKPLRSFSPTGVYISR
jgi:hypothetical protein